MHTIPTVHSHVQRKKALLSGQREKVRDGASPLPLYTCLHAKKDVPASEFHEWIEFSPYEVGLPKYGVSVRTEDFGSRFYIGSIIHKYPEPRLTYLQGGSRLQHRHGATVFSGTFVAAYAFVQARPVVSHSCPFASHFLQVSGGVRSQFCSNVLWPRPARRTSSNV